MIGIALGILAVSCAFVVLVVAIGSVIAVVTCEDSYDIDMEPPK